MALTDEKSMVHDSNLFKALIMQPSAGAAGGNQMPEGEGKRDKIRPRYDLIPHEFLDAIADIFEEGLRPRSGLPDGYGDSWKRGGNNFLRDVLNHAVWHLWSYIKGDRSEHHLPKVAWACLVKDWHDKQEKP